MLPHGLRQIDIEKSAKKPLKGGAPRHSKQLLRDRPMLSVHGSLGLGGRLLDRESSVGMRLAGIVPATKVS
jgi:hypothetical protein